MDTSYDTPTLPPPTPEEAAEALATVKDVAACELLLTVEKLAHRLGDPTVNFKQLMDGAEFMYKVSGMAAKQADKPTGTGFSITIKLPGTGGQDIVIGSGSADVEQVDKFPKAPAWLTSTAVEIEDL